MYKTLAEIRKTVTSQQLVAIRKWADINAAQWVLDLLYNECVNNRGPMQGLRVCDCAAVRFLSVI